MEQAGSKDNRISAVDQARAAVNLAQRALLDHLLACDRYEIWAQDGCRDFAHWVSLRMGISTWAARRWIRAAEVLPTLPLISEAFARGLLSLEKVVELCRFATPQTEAKLITWAKRVSVAAIRHKGDVAGRVEEKDVVEADKRRHLRWWWSDDGLGLGLEGFFSPHQGAVVAQALDRMAGRLPDVIECDCENDDDCGCTTDRAASFDEPLDVRRADALYLLCSQKISSDPDPDRATVVVHAPLFSLLADQGLCEIAGGSVIDPETARLLSCDCRLETVLEEGNGKIVGIGRASRIVPRWLKRQLLHRDKGCTFPGCELTRFLHAHHIRHWIRGGRTDLDNLVLLCPFHHKLVHAYGWSVELGDDGSTKWFRPNGQPHDRTRVSDRAPPLRAA